MKALVGFLLLSVAFCYTTAAQTSGVAVDAGWLTVRDINIEIKAGSPLDFSQLFPAQSAESMAQVSVNANGQFTVDGAPTRFLCAAMNLGPPYGGYPSPADADRYALQLRRAGYNLVRIHHIDSTLMTDRRGDFDYDPEQLNRFQYFLAALKKQGIYWMLDAMSSENAAWGNVTPHRWVNRHNMKVRVYVDPIAQAHWRHLVETLYGRVNPYTGISILKDPALLGLSFVNEGGLQFLTHVGKKIPEQLRPALQQWLSQRYINKTQFEDVWKQPFGNLSSNALVLPDATERTARMDDVLVFYGELQRQTARWMADYVAGLGSQTLTTSYNNMPTSHAAHTRANFTWVDMHAYHDEGFGFKPGATIRNDSSFDAGLQYILDLSTASLSGRAFSVSEYGQPFWNAWRRESALIAPAYASFQDWGAICQHASTAVDLTYAQSKGWKQSIVPYAVGLDPVGRVVETLAALLYRRQDVSFGRDVVAIDLPGGAGEATAQYWGVPKNVAQVALVSKVRTRLAEDGPASGPRPAASLSLLPESGVSHKLAGWISLIGRNVGPNNVNINDIARAQHQDSATRAESGIFETSTGELLARLVDRQFEVRTPLTAGIVFEKLNAPYKIGPMRLLPNAQPTLVAISSLDNKPLDQSRSMLLIVASDALNTGMQFQDSNRQVLAEIGKLPARVEPRKVSLVFQADASLTVTALRANGEAAEVLGARIDADRAVVDIDFEKLKAGPSFYFHVTRATSTLPR